MDSSTPSFLAFWSGFSYQLYYTLRCLYIVIIFSSVSLQDALYELHDASGDAQIFIGERYMEGAYVKFNNNGGSVNKEDHRHHCDLDESSSAQPFPVAERLKEIWTLSRIPELR